MAMGLDRDDTIIRRRLRQKLEFLAEDTIDATPPTDAELRAWLDQHPETFRIEPEVAFRQVYLSPDRRGASVDEDARTLLAQLSAAGPSVGIDTVGDSLMLPHEVERSTRADVARQSGEEFADAVLKVEPGRWTGPIRSGYGLHPVWVYVFYLSSDDGSRLSVAGREIIVNDGVHGLAEEKAEIALAAGWHDFELVYFQGSGGMGLGLSWRGPWAAKAAVPSSAFGH